jgi:hypothetical protein
MRVPANGEYERMEKAGRLNQNDDMKGVRRRLVLSVRLAYSPTAVLAGRFLPFPGLRWASV